MSKQVRKCDSTVSKSRLLIWASVVMLSVVVLSTFSGLDWMDRIRVTETRVESLTSEKTKYTEFTEFRGEGLLRPEVGTNFPLRIYVYEADEIDGLKDLLTGHTGLITPSNCMFGMWGTQVKIHLYLLDSSFRTKKKEEATLFFVPAYVKCVRLSRKNGLDDAEINEKYIQVISQMPYFKRSGGRDHIFVFPSGNGAHFFKDWAMHINRSIFLTPEGDRTDKKAFTAFNTWKDIIIPGNIDSVRFEDGVAQGSVTPIPLHKRKFLANYIGHAQGKAGRLSLLQLAKKYPNEINVPELALRGSDDFLKEEYFQHLGDAKFCLAPRGQSSWTLRFFEAFFVDCVPVILSDRIELPFQNVLDYKQFTIKWPQARIDESLLQYLRSIPDEAIQRMIARGRQVRCLWIYSGESEKCSAMTGILWELQRKVRLFHQSSETFWLHDGTFINDDLSRMNILAQTSGPSIDFPLVVE